LKVEIFSSEAGKWRESIVSFTQEINWDPEYTSMTL
jgi:hypothetical protein